MENPTPAEVKTQPSTVEVLTTLRSSLDSALTALTTTKEKTSDVADSIKRMKDDGALSLLVERYADLTSDEVASRDDLLSEFELTIDYGNTVEVADYSLDTDSVAYVVKDALNHFVEELFTQLSNDYS